MVFDFKRFFCEESVLVDRYDLTDRLVNNIELLFKWYIDYKNVDEDIELLIPCILFVLQINDFEIDLRDEALFMAAIFFDKEECNHRSIDILYNFEELCDCYPELIWWL